jgi:hypothetical protein
MIRHREVFDRIDPYVDSPEAIIITGMRQTGKTTLLNHFYQKIHSKNKLYLDLENPLNRRYFEEENYERIKSSLEFLGLDLSQRAIVFLDEIQFVKNLPSVVKYLIDHYKVKFFLTGSASFYLKNLFTESLAGRKYIFELHPLTFKEFLVFKDLSLRIPDDPQKVTFPIYQTLAPLYEEYMMFGGFPAVVLKKTVEEKKRTLDDIFSSYFQLEVVQLGDFRRNEVIRDLMLLLVERIGSKLDISKLSRELRISRVTVADYISFLEGTYFIQRIRPFTRGRNSEIRKSPKVYLCDTGLANQLARLDEGRLFENSVFQNLRPKGTLNYYQRKSGVEIDFILNKEYAYEVKVNPTNSDLRKLSALAGQLKLKDYRLVSKDYSELENIVYAFTLG